MTKKSAVEILAENVTALMDLHDVNAYDIQNKTGIGRSTVYNIKNKSFNANSETIQELAEFFKIPAWALFVPGLDVTAKSDDLEIVIARFLGLNQDGRKEMLSHASYLLSKAPRTI